MKGCEQPECGARALRGSAFCRRHKLEDGADGRAGPASEPPAPRKAEPAATPDDGEDQAPLGAEPPGQWLYAKYLRAEERAFFEEAAGWSDKTSLDNEIAAARLAVLRALTAEDAAGLARATGVSRATMIVAQLQKMRQHLEGAQATGIVEAINQILAELGLDD